jgi:hypothetical protein
MEKNEETVGYNIDFPSIVERIKKIENETSDRQFAIAIGMRNDSYSNAKKRGTFPYEKIINYCFVNNYSLDEIFGMKNPIKPALESNENTNKECNSIYIESIENKQTIKLPANLFDEERTSKDIKYYIDENDTIFIVDTIGRKLEDRNSYLIKLFNNLYIKDVSIDLSHNFKLKENGFDEIIVKNEELFKIEVLGKVILTYKKA